MDLILVETVFDTLNAKAALFAIDQYCEENHCQLPVMISVTITDQSGRTLSGQTIEAFWNSMAHAHPDECRYQLRLRGKANAALYPRTV